MNWPITSFGLPSYFPTFQSQTPSYGYGFPQMSLPQMPQWGMSAYGSPYSYAPFQTPVPSFGMWRAVQNASIPAGAIAWASAARAGIGNMAGNIFDFFNASAQATRMRQWMTQNGYTPVSQSPTSPSKEKPPLPDILSRASTYYRYRGDPKEYNKVIAASMSASHPEVREVKEGDVSKMVEDIEKKQVDGRNLIGREALLKKFAENSQNILASIDPSIREDLLAGHQSLKIRHNLVNPDGTTRSLEAKYMTDDVAADMLLLLLGRSEKANQQSRGALQEFLSSRGLVAESEDGSDLGAKGVMLLKDYFGGNWRDVLQMFYQQTVNDAGQITEFPDYNDAATVQHYLINRKHFRPEVAAVIGKYGATYPSERVARVLKLTKDIKSLKNDDDQKISVGEQEYNTYLNTIALLCGYQKANIESQDRSIMKIAPGSGDDKQHRYKAYVPDFRNKEKVAKYLHTFMDRLVEIEQLKARHYSAHDPSWIDKYNTAFDKKMKEYRRADKTL